MQRIIVVALAFLLIAGSSAAGQRRSRVRGKSNGVATPCDRVAAHPADPAARARGVSNDKLDESAVITRCEAEVRADPSSPRLTFQLARGYLKAGRVEDAIEQLVVAAQGGHGGALAYLGDLYLDGAVGLEADPLLAHTLYRRAAEASFTPAKAILAQFEDYTERAAAEDESEAAAARTKYINPQIVDNIFKGELDAVPFGELYTKIYLVNMAENIFGVCEDHFTSREVDALKLEAAQKSVDMTPESGLTMLMGLLMGAAQMRQNPDVFLTQQTEAAMNQENLPEEAMKDAFALIGRYPCGSRELSQFSRNLISYIRNEGSPRMSTNDMYALCQREARPTGRYDARNFCMCFISAMTQTGVSRADRKGLSSDFWGTARAMMAKKPAHFAMCNQ